jgi:HK97 gp10 family phage protein
VSVLSVQQWMGELVRETQKVNAEASMIVRGAAFLCQRRAIQNAPVDTGFLRNSITVGDIYGGSLQPGALSAQVGPEAEYGGWVESGTSRNPNPQPYLIPAAEEARKWMEERMSKDLGIR